MQMQLEQTDDCLGFMVFLGFFQKIKETQPLTSLHATCKVCVRRTAEKALNKISRL